MSWSAGSPRCVAGPRRRPSRPEADVARLTRRGFVASAAALAAAGPALAAARPDANAAYARAYAEAIATRGLTGALPARLPEAIAAELRQGPVIFIGGFLKQLADAIASTLGKPVGLGGYFDAQRDALALQGIDAVELEVNSAGSIARNAPVVADAIARAPGPVTLVTHSKGSLDALQALIDRPTLASPARLRARVSLQAPIFGSPLADLNTENALARPITSYLLEHAFGGSPDTMSDLSMATRGAYQAEHAADIASIVQAVPTVCYGSWLTDTQPSLFRGTWLICKLAGQPRNDGLVGVPSAHLSGTIGVDEAGVDHAMPVMVMPGTGPFDPVSCLTALLTLALA
ncbi:MAG: hypothetical protein AB7X49_15755 [Geminicoccaceae bacterium]